MIVIMKKYLKENFLYIILGFIFSFAWVYLEESFSWSLCIFLGLLSIIISVSLTSKYYRPE